MSRFLGSDGEHQAVHDLSGGKHVSAHAHPVRPSQEVANAASAPADSSTPGITTRAVAASRFKCIDVAASRGGKWCAHHETLTTARPGEHDLVLWLPSGCLVLSFSASYTLIDYIIAFVSTTQDNVAEENRWRTKLAKRIGKGFSQVRAGLNRSRVVGREGATSLADP